MPLAVDSSKPIRTITPDGQALTGTTQGRKVVDNAGRPIAPKAATPESTTEAQKALQTDIKAEAQKAGEPAAETKEPSTTEAKPAEGKEDEKITEAKIRREYLEAQKIKREAQDMQKKAKANLQKAQAFEHAKTMLENGEDPATVLANAGIDPIKFYQNMTKFATSEKGKQVEADPVKRELNEHKARLDKYAKDLEDQAKTLREKEDTAIHNSIIQENVIPLLKDNSDKYEILLLHYGNQAAVEVYKNVWAFYQETGQAKSFAEAADEMEKFWSDQIGTNLEKALSTKRFKERFSTQAALGTSENNTEQNTETPKNSSITLSNSNSNHIASSSANGKYRYNGMTPEEKKAAVLKMFDK